MEPGSEILGQVSGTQSEPVLRRFPQARLEQTGTRTGPLFIGGKVDGRPGGQSLLA